VSVRALRYYEEQGLLQSSRSARGQRVYREEAEARVRLIRQLFAAGLSSRKIVDLLPCMESASVTGDQLDAMRAECDALTRSIADMAAARDRLRHMIASTTPYGGDCEPAPGDTQRWLVTA
jgi:DNA-binding transcriptional MerR regulator